jgi:hypothetical protein
MSGHIGVAKRRARHKFRIIGGKFETDIKGLLDVGRLARIKRLAAERDVAAVAAGTAK